MRTLTADVNILAPTVLLVTQKYLGYDSRTGFENKIFVKINAAKVLEKELLSPKWKNEHSLRLADERVLAFACTGKYPT